MSEALSSRLKNRVEIWGLTDDTNSLGESDSDEIRLAILYCDIVPKSGKVNEIPNASAQYETITHEVTFRRSAMKHLRPENHIRYGDSRYEIEYIMPHYNEPDRIIAYCCEEVNL